MNFFDFGEVIQSDTEFVIFGIPWDGFTSLDNLNTAMAPRYIREASQTLSLTSELGKIIPDLKAVDLGDIPIKSSEDIQNLKQISAFINNLYTQKQDIILVMIGGNHFCTFPVLKSVEEKLNVHEDYGVLIFDAHLDLYNMFNNNTYSHATVAHRIYDLNHIHSNNILIVGARDIDIPELNFAKQENISYLNAYESIEGLEKYIDRIISFFHKSQIENLYISIDIDALDPSVAPATGYPIPGGFSYRNMWRILRGISQKFNLIGFDVVEVSPNLDLPNKITGNLAAKIIIELLSFISNK
jgi:agmatinase